MDEIALGATVFQREEKVASLLKSVSSDLPISTVYIGDNGDITDRKQEIYADDYSFDLTVLDLEYDSGLGYSRQQIVKNSDEPYLLIVDSDVTIPKNVMDLYTILEAREDLGGVGGVLIEDSRIRGDSHDLFEEDSLLVKDIRGPKPVQKVEGHPLVEFDQIQNVTMYRRECVEDYTWDPEYRIGWEHTDFFVAQKHQTDWNFGVAPHVMFRHYPGGGETYMNDRLDKNRIQHSKQYFLDKWDYDQVLIGQVNWLQTTSRMPSKVQLTEQLLKHGIMALPTELQIAVMNFRDAWRRIQGKPPA